MSNIALPKSIGKRKGQKGRKIGRSAKKPSFQRYKTSIRWITNKIKKVMKHIKNHKEDNQAVEDLRRIKNERV